uniref:Uncharacterized protein n=1 Tax=Spironucleus salmonicida TaxID=348837 RepID=V6LFQ1_9EUKA|eukprot:EST43118.1 Hypothetical protein SS50377_17276 [Spironucleus salmonicida]
MAAIQFEQLGKRYQIHTPHDLTPSTLNEYGDLTFDVGYLPYNTLFYLTADGELLWGGDLVGLEFAALLLKRPP